MTRTCPVVEIIVSILGLTPSALCAQDFQSEARQMSAAVQRLERYVVHVEVRASDSTGRRVLARRVTSTRVGDRYLFEADSMSILVTPSATVLVNHADRTIAYSHAGGTQLAREATNVFDPDSLLRVVDSVESLASSREMLRYAIYYNRGPLARAEISVDRKLHLPVELAYQYSVATGNGLTVVIHYNWDVSPDLDLDALRPTRYVTVTEATVRPSPLYAGYHVRQAAPDE